MARKKRGIVTSVAPTKDAEKAAAARYRDSFQENVGGKVEEIGKSLEKKSSSLIYGLGATAIAALLLGFIYLYWSRSNVAAETALGKAIETSQAAVTTAPVPQGSTQKQYKTVAERSQAAITEFQSVADSYGGAVGEKAKYFIAVNRLIIDRAAGIQELESLAKSSGEIGSLSKFALAQTRADDGKPDEAISLYNDLLKESNPVVSKETISYSLAMLYDKQGRKQEAVDTLFNLVKTASDAKNLEGKPVGLSPSAQAAKDKLKQLDPEKAKEIPEPSETPVDQNLINM